MVWGHWTEDQLFQACDSFTLIDPGGDEDPFSIAPGVTFTLRAGRAVAFDGGTSVSSGASLTIEIDPQLRQ